MLLLLFKVYDVFALPFTFSKKIYTANSQSRGGEVTPKGLVILLAEGFLILNSLISDSSPLFKSSKFTIST